MINQTLNNRYKITSRLGKGAMGTVYRATDTQTGHEVALKVIASELAVEPEMLERFKREGEALRQLKHPNIVGFIGAFEHDEHYVIVMEYISGGSLHELIKQGPMPVEQARQIALDLCDALIRAHRLNIIHRDIKPENILIDQDGIPKLADFGVARLSEGTRMTRSGTQVGTPYYMAPESWEGKALDAQADIWSLGVLLFEMLTGQVPFGGDTGAAVMNKVLTTQPPDPKKLRVDVPPGLVKIIKRMLTRDRKRRYPTMREVAVDLERDQRATVAVAPKKSKSGRWLPALIGLGLVMAVSAVWLVTQFQGAQSTEQVASPGGSPTKTPRPSATPIPTNTSTPVPIPLIEDLGPVVFSESFDDLDFPFTTPGLGRIESGVLVLDGIGNGIYASFLVEPDITTIILFKTTRGTQFNIGYNTGGYGTESLRRFSFESFGRWDLYEGNVDANGGNIPIKKWQASPLQFDTWHYFLLTRSTNGDMDAKIFERDNPQNMIEFHENLGAEWGKYPLSSFIDFRLGTVFLDEYQDIQSTGETPTSIPASITVFSTDFNSGVPPQFSGVVITDSVQGYEGIGTGTNVFGGDFLRNSSIPPAPTTLTLTDLPAHTSIDLHFLLAIIDSWDGASIDGDTFTITIDGKSVFTEVFDNVGGLQSYNPPSDVELVRTVELGFRDIDEHDQESAYDMGNDPTFANIPHTSSTLTIQWYASGSNWQGESDESWAIDNLEVILK